MIASPILVDPVIVVNFEFDFVNSSHASGAVLARIPVVAPTHDKVLLL
jgi:hypothetical protein